MKVTRDTETTTRAKVSTGAHILAMGAALGWIVGALLGVSPPPTDTVHRSPITSPVGLASNSYATWYLCYPGEYWVRYDAVSYWRHQGYRCYPASGFIG